MALHAFDFNSGFPTVMHVDINSCFATVEQQANPRLRGKPVVVAAYAEDHGCILAASIEANRLGIKTGMRVREAKVIFRNVVVLAPDPDKYRFVNRALLKLLASYSSNVSVESIDEMVMSLQGSPSLERFIIKQRYCHFAGVSELNKEQISLIHNSVFTNQEVELAMKETGKEIKRRIKGEIGDWLTVSIGIAPNRYLAKVASGLKKPDGLDLITRETIVSVLSRLKLEDLCGIKMATANRLRYAGILNPLMMYEVNAEILQRAFQSITGYRWWMRLHGYDPSTDSGQETFSAFGKNSQEQKSFGQSYAMGKPYTPQSTGLHQVLTQLVMKMGRRLRTAGCTARGIGVSTLFTDYSHWHQQHTFAQNFYADSDFYKKIQQMLLAAPRAPVRILAVYCYKLEFGSGQESLLPEDNRKRHLTEAIDAVHERFGDFVITPGRMLHMDQKVLDRIAFGKVRDLHRLV